MTQNAEIVVTDVRLGLVPGERPAFPLEPVVHGARVRLGNDALEKVVRAVLTKMRDRVPADIQVQAARFIEGGCEITAVVSKGRFMKADVRAVIGVAAQGAERVTVAVQDVKALGMLPLDAFVAPVLERALAMASARPGIARSATNARALEIDPAQVVKALGMPVRVAEGGVWIVRASSGELEMELTAAEQVHSLT
ncbi:MAG: hypothetical protein C4346_01540 [Chloroflexota bacterium]